MGAFRGNGVETPRDGWVSWDSFGMGWNWMGTEWNWIGTEWNSLEEGDFAWELSKIA
jgi:hypothetical protein